MKVRLRRLRGSSIIRQMLRETHLSADDLVMPLFVKAGGQSRTPIVSMPGQSQLSVDLLVDECRELSELGVKAVLLFGIPESKDEIGSSGLDEDGIIPRAVRAIKSADLDLLVITDVCLCEYTSHGHCGVLREKNGDLIVDNDATVELLAKMSVAHAKAGADIIAPSDMMDGRVGVIRDALDREGFEDVMIMSYAAKFASGFYGPFREAAESAPKFGDRKSYQMDYHNAAQAMREIELDIQEGADVIMVKPALAYLDIISRAKQNFNLPLACYSVSGEYAMIKAAANQGWLDEQSCVTESLVSMKRAGADIIITYFAKDVARWLGK